MDTRPGMTMLWVNTSIEHSSRAQSPYCGVRFLPAPGPGSTALHSSHVSSQTSGVNKLTSTGCLQTRVVMNSFDGC